jgi:hypothetical protein
MSNDEYEDDRPRSPGTVMDADNGQPRVCAQMCDTCIFRAGNPMGLRPGRVRQMVRDSLAGGGYITCHETDNDGCQAAVCGGFLQRYGAQSNVLRIWERLGGFKEIEPPGLARSKEET